MSGAAALIPAAVGAAIGVGKTIAGGISSIVNNRRLKKLEKQRPVYTIQPEYSANQAIAANQAYGRNRAITQAEQNIAANTADGIAAAQQSSQSGNAILAALSAMRQNQNAAYRDLSVQEASAQLQGAQNLMLANQAMAEERDKEWNYNVNEPYQNKVAMARDRRKRANEMIDQGLDLTASAAISAMGSGGGGGGGSKLFSGRKSGFNASLSDPRNIPT